MNGEIQPPTLSRRTFLLANACALCHARQLLAASPELLAQLAVDARPRLLVLFAHLDLKLQGWPYQGYDFEGRKKSLLAALKRACPGIEFLPATAQTAEEAEKLLGQYTDVDGWVVYLLGLPSSAGRPVAFSGRPTLLVDDLYGGTGQFLALYGEAVRKGLPVAGVASSRIEDVTLALRAFEAIKKLRASTLLDVTDRDVSQAIPLYKETLGLAIQQVNASELVTAYEGVNRQEAQPWAARWIREAAKVVEPSREEIERSARMYLAMIRLMTRYRAQGIAVDCLRLFYDGKLPAYPCLGFFQLNNDGLVGACEADLESAATMLLITYLTNRPGYISDPVIDMAANQVVYAHCVAPNKVYGPAGKANPYHIRNHSEDRQGAAVRSLMPVGEMTTTLKLVPRQKLVVFHQGRTVANIDEDRACRTKLAVQVRNARKLAEDWAWGWHRVTVYGDWRNQLEIATRLMGFRLVEEG